MYNIYLPFYASKMHCIIAADNFRLSFVFKKMKDDHLLFLLGNGQKDVKLAEAKSRKCMLNLKVHVKCMLKSVKSWHAHISCVVTCPSCMRFEDKLF